MTKCAELVTGKQREPWKAVKSPKCILAGQSWARVSFPMRPLLALLGFSAAVALFAAPDDPLVRGFNSPPPDARPLVFWQWMNGCVTKEGIVSDLDSFQRVGLAGVQQFLVGGSEATITDPTVEILNPKWRELMHFAETEAARRGLTFGTHNCPGWSASGGPWIKPDDAMQKLVWTATEIDGGQSVQRQIEQPTVDARWKYYHDIVTVAVPIAPAPGAVTLAQIVDLSSAIGADGVLRWNAPPGQWRVLRFGRTLTGTTNGTAPASGQGLEVDKMSKGALDRFYAAYPGQLIKDAGELAGHTFRRLESDSYEAGVQTWTPELPAEFRRRRGYELQPWLPVLAGTVVENAEQTARFREDWERTIAELVGENYYGHLAELIHRTPGMEYLLEPYATGHGEPFDLTAVGAAGDTLMCEFWQKPSTWGWDSVRPVASAVHTWGKRIVAAEAFTGQPQYGWRVAPFDLKTTGDRAFSEGVNRVVLHAAAHQPWPHLKPGMTMGWWGTQFGPGQTWWEHGGPEWIAYLSRCQFLLQQGKFVADLCFLGRGHDRPALPPGYNADVIGERALLERMEIREGRWSLPDGMSYRVLVLPAAAHLPVEILRKVRDLVRAGGTVLGVAPQRATGRQNYPACDADIAEIARDLWGDLDGVVRTERTCGEGRVFSGVPPAQVLRRLGIARDVEFETTPSPVAWIHRQLAGNDLYFLANQQETSTAVDVLLRATAHSTEIWHPESGKMELARSTRTEDGRTRLHLEFPPAGSCFVVLRGTATEGLAIPQSYVTDEKSVREIVGPWSVSFPPGLGAPAEITLPRTESWTENTEPGVRYFSGTATYRHQFTATASDTATPRRLILDLGRVEKIAAVRVNGSVYPALWAPPFRVDITAAVHPGVNDLAIEVTNLWPNRLIGDEHEPDDAAWGKPDMFKFVEPARLIGQRLIEVPNWVTTHQPRPAAGRITFTTYKFFTADSPLLPSGLLGPVRLEPQLPANSSPSTAAAR
jgi:hypothetical protein